MIYSELLDRAYFQALRGMDANTAPNLDDATTIMEALVPSIFQAVAESYAADPRKQSLLRRTHTLTVTNGVATLPDEVLTSCLWNGSIADPNDVTVAQAQSFVAQFYDFIQPRDNWQIQLNWWNVKGDTEFHFLAANDEYDPNDGFDGDLDYTGPSVPEIPANASDTVNVPSEVASDLVESLANALRGAIAAQAAKAAA